MYIKIYFNLCIYIWPVKEIIVIGIKEIILMLIFIEMCIL